MKMYKIMFLNSMILGTIITISSYSWMSMWMGLEINLLSIIPLLSSSKNQLSSESSMKYFITQAMASLILLSSVILLLTTSEFIPPLMNFYFSMMMNSALMTKMGAAPFHFWLPEMIEGLSWINSLIILTWQKIAPMMIAMNNKIETKFLIIIILACLIISTSSSFNQVSLRKILAYSSINHMGWMLSTFIMSKASWTIYFIIYALINILIISSLSISKSFYINQISMSLNKNKMTKLSLMINFLSLAGLPPFIGFLPKWIIISWMTNNNMILITITMIIVTLVMTFIYIQIMASSMMISINEPKTNKSEIKSQWLTTINSISLMSLPACTLIPSLI